MQKNIEGEANHMQKQAASTVQAKGSLAKGLAQEVAIPLCEFKVCPSHATQRPLTKPTTLATPCSIHTPVGVHGPMRFVAHRGNTSSTHTPGNITQPENNTKTIITHQTPTQNANIIIQKVHPTYKHSHHQNPPQLQTQHTQQPHRIQPLHTQHQPNMPTPLAQVRGRFGSDRLWM